MTELFLSFLSFCKIFDRSVISPSLRRQKEREFQKSFSYSLPYFFKDTLILLPI